MFLNTREQESKKSELRENRARLLIHREDRLARLSLERYGATGRAESRPVEIKMAMCHEKEMGKVYPLLFFRHRHGLEASDFRPVLHSDFKLETQECLSPR